MQVSRALLYNSSFLIILSCEYWSFFNLILSEATWENGKLIEELCQEQIRAYKEREESRCDFFSRFHM